MPRHIVQSAEWGEFKNRYGTPAIIAGNVLYTKHKIPFTESYFAYCPRIDPSDVDFENLSISLKENNCVSINFDVPNILSGTDSEKKSIDTFMKYNCEKSPRDQFAKATILLDITKSEDTLLSQMHNKHRYNITYAQKKGVVVKKAETAEDYQKFYKLFKETAERQHYYVRPSEYYKLLWEMFRPKDMCEILTAELNGAPLASWMFLKYENVLYYPYGGSSEDSRNLHASNLVAWEGIRLGKEKECTVFDMWGAAEDINDTHDAWWGFTNFKIKFGGNYVRYMDSYDFIITDPVYRIFTLANNLRWKVLKLIA